MRPPPALVEIVPAKSEPHRSLGIHPDPRVIRTTMPEHLRHGAQGFPDGVCAYGGALDQTDYAAHGTAEPDKWKDKWNPVGWSGRAWQRLR